MGLSEDTENSMDFAEIMSQSSPGGEEAQDPADAKSAADAGRHTGKKAAQDETDTDGRNLWDADIPEGLSVEDAFAQLQQILDRMDAEGVSLEESFRCYERGMKLIRYCNETIDRVEKKVRVLSANLDEESE